MRKVLAPKTIKLIFVKIPFLNLYMIEVCHYCFFVVIFWIVDVYFSSYSVQLIIKKLPASDFQSRVSFFNIHFIRNNFIHNIPGEEHDSIQKKFWSIKYTIESENILEFVKGLLRKFDSEVKINIKLAL